MVYFGNLHAGTVMIDAKPIPGTKKSSPSFRPGHGRREHDGRIHGYRPGNGPDDRGLGPGGSRRSRNTIFRDPWAFSEDLFHRRRASGSCLLDGGGRSRRSITLR